MNFFLQGDSQIGKSFLIQSMLNAKDGFIAGFTVQRLLKEDSIIGFRICEINQKFSPLEADFNENLTNIFISPNRKDLLVLENAILKVEKEANLLKTRIILLDEIGGLELMSDVFMESLLNILNSGKACVGVLKSKNNLMRMLSNTNSENGEVYCLKHEKLIETITSDGSIHTLTSNNKEDIRLKLSKFLDCIE